MIVRFVIIDVPRSNFAKAEVGMNVEISTKKFMFFSDENFKKIRISDNEALKVLRDAFRDKYSVDLKEDGVLTFPLDRHFKCEKII